MLPISVWSRFGEDSDISKRMSAKSLLIPGTPWMDFFNPEGQKTFWAKLKTGLFDYGLDGWWMDASEPEFDILKGHQTFLGSGESVTGTTSNAVEPLPKLSLTIPPKEL